MPVKLGPHKQRSTAAGAYFSANAIITKSLDPAGLDSARSGATTVYRKYFQYQDINLNGGDIARQVIADLGGRRPTYLELYNEIAQTWNEGFPRYLEFHKEAAPVVHAYGCGLLGYSFSTWEHPALDTWAYMAQNRWGDVDAIGIHEYWGPSGFTSVNALYHRVLHAANPNHPPFIISETGRDNVEGANCYGQTHCGWIAQQVPASQYVQELLNYDGLLQQDSYVIGGTIFTSGYNDPFANFEIDSIIPALIGGGPPPPLPPRPPSGFPWWAIVAGVTGAGLAAMIIAEPGVSEAGPPTPGMPSGRGLRYILEGEPVPTGYTVVGEWR